MLEERVELFGTVVEVCSQQVGVGRELLHVVEGLLQVGIGSQRVERQDERIYMLQYLTYLGHHLGHLLEEAVRVVTLNGVAHGYRLLGVGTHLQVQRAASQHTFCQAGLCAYGHTYIAIYADFHQHFTWLVEVVGDVAHDAYLVAVGIDRTARGQSLGVGKGNVVVMTRGETHSLQETHSQIQDCQSGYSGEAYLDFFGKELHLFLFL